MKISGLIPSSLVDYPGCISAVIFTQGCNLRCGFCHNPDLINPNPLFKKYISEDEVIGYLSSNKKWLDGLVLLGGEPTIQPDLVKFCRKVKNLTKIKIKLDTNGLNPIVVEELINNKLIDFVAMDIKVSYLSNKDYIRTKDLLISRGFPHEFRLTCVPDRVVDENIGMILNYFKGAQRVYLQNFRNEKTLDKKLKKVKPYLTPKLVEWKNKYKDSFQFMGIR